MIRAQSHIGALTLGLLLAFFAHDVLMASGSHTSAYVAHHHNELEPERECGLTRGTHTQTASGFNVDDQTAGQPTAPLTHKMTGFVPHWSIDPDHPPAIKRALLQVYLN